MASLITSTARRKLSSHIPFQRILSSSSSRSSSALTALSSICRSSPALSILSSSPILLPLSSVASPSHFSPFVSERQTQLKLHRFFSSSSSNNNNHDSGVDAIKDTVKRMKDTLKEKAEKAKAVVTETGEKAKTRAEKVKGSMTEKGEEMREKLREVKENMGDYTENMRAKAREKMGKARERVEDAKESTKEKMKEKGEEMREKMGKAKRRAEDTRNSMKAKAGENMEGAKGKMQDVKEGMKKKATEKGGEMGEKTGKMKEGVEEIAENVTAKARGKMGRAKDRMAEARERMKKKGEEMREEEVKMATKKMQEEGGREEEEGGREEEEGGKGEQKVEAEIVKPGGKRDASFWLWEDPFFSPLSSSLLSPLASMFPELYHPFGMLRNISARSLFGDILRSSMALMNQLPKVQMDVSESADSFTIKADLPAGVKKEHIKVKVEDNVLTILGQRKEESEGKQGDVRKVERRFGSFQRCVQLPETVKSEGIEAKMENGVLEIKLPKQKPEQKKSEEIPIK